MTQPQAASHWQTCTRFYNLKLCSTYDTVQERIQLNKPRKRVSNLKTITTCYQYKRYIPSNVDSNALAACSSPVNDSMRAASTALLSSPVRLRSRAQSAWSSTLESGSPRRGLSSDRCISFEASHWATTTSSSLEHPVVIDSGNDKTIMMFRQVCKCRRTELTILWLPIYSIFS
jgi:hypothetical protein